MRKALLDQARALWGEQFGGVPVVAAYAPGRVEILGNHTDYNEGWALSAAIDRGTVFLAAPAPDTRCRLIAGDVKEMAAFDIRTVVPSREQPWSNYVKGVLDRLLAIQPATAGFDALFLGDIPIGAGLSSSAALEMAAGLALAELYGIAIGKLDLAKAGQTAEHDFAGARCGLLDQLSSLYGQRHALALIDFRSLAVRTVPLEKDLRVLVCDTQVKHALVDGEYNERRARCEAAAAAFAEMLKRPVAALRDVSWTEWETFSATLDPVTARRAAHVIGENKRVLDGVTLLEQGRPEAFGRLMFESHASSVKYFENSCPELDILVSAARALPGVMGARLSGGGFGGSAVVLTRAQHADAVGQSLADAYAQRFGQPCAILNIQPADGASILPTSTAAEMACARRGSEPLQIS